MKKLFFGLVVFTVMVGLCLAQTEYKKFYKLGTAPLVKGGISNIGQLERVLSEETKAIALALSSEEPAIMAFYQQLIRGMGFKERNIQPGEKIEIMVFRWGGKIQKVEKLEWAGEESFEAFIFNFTFEDKKYFFLVPKICGNICLQKIEKVQLPAKEITLPLEIFKPDQPVEPKFEPKPRFEPEPRPQLEPESKITYQRYFVDMGIGGFRGCYQEYVVGRVGLLHRFGSMAEFVLLAGAGLPLEWESDSWKTVPMLDIGLNCRFSFFVLGIGAGISGRVKDAKKDQLEGIVSFGVQPSKNINIFFEGRMPVSRQTGLYNNHKVVIGLRTFF